MEERGERSGRRSARREVKEARGDRVSGRSIDADDSTIRVRGGAPGRGRMGRFAARTAACWTMSRMVIVSWASARGYALGLTSAMASVGDCAMERRGVGERQRAPRRFAEEGLVFPRPPRGRGGEENRPMGGGGRARTHVLSFTAWRWLSCARRIRGTTQSRSPGRSRGVRTGAGGLSGARAGVGGGGAVAQLFDGWRRSAVRSAGRRYEYDRPVVVASRPRRPLPCLIINTTPLVAPHRTGRPRDGA